jgi:cytochrome c-type biogenesis protein CcmH
VDRRSALLVALVAALVVAAPAFGGGRPTAEQIETKLICPVCHETLDQSSSPAAEQMKGEIRRRLAQGWTEKQILDEMVANYGPGVLSEPAKHGFDLLAWLLPIGAAVLGVAALAAAARYWSRRDPPPSQGTPALDPAMEARLDAELASFDG